MPDPQGGAVASGALAAHVLVTLRDTDSATVVRGDVIDDQALVGSDLQTPAVDARSFVTPEQRVRLLRETLAHSLRRVRPELFKGL